MTSPPDYRVDDRSILLPSYRRWLVDPLLPLIPRRVSPNWITHAGHVCCFAAAFLLVGLWPKQGWPFVAAAVLLQLYVWCDNADGAHARRTNQCSPLGEYLDHGLDILNTVYMGFLTAMALGASPIAWVTFVLLIPGAAAIVMWEQAATGVYRLGLINQIESSLVLSAALLLSAAFGQDFFRTTRVLGIELRDVMALWCAATILFGMARGLGRVARARGFASLAPAAALMTFGLLSTYAVAIGALTTVAAVTIATGVNIAFCARMLTSRLHGRTPRTMSSLWLFIGVVTCALAARHAFDVTVPSAVVAVVACVIFGSQTASDARVGFQRLAHA